MATGTQGLLQIRQKRHVVLEVLRFATTFRRHGILPDICKSSIYHGGEGQENKPVDIDAIKTMGGHEGQ